MKIKNIYIVAMALVGLAAGACSDSSSGSYDYSGYTDALVYGFKLPYNATYCTDSINNYHFTINHYGDGRMDDNGIPYGLIYNADSLPYNMQVSSLLAEITFSGAKEAILFYGEEDKETTYDSTDSIDFTNPFLMKVLAGNGVNSKVYEVKVNVHQMVGDSIHWSQFVSNPLADASDVVAERTVVINGNACWFVSGQTEDAVYTSESGNLMSWSKNQIVSPERLNVRTVKSFDGSFYAVSEANNLMRSADGLNWSAVAADGLHFESLLGGALKDDIATKRLLAIVQENGEYLHAYSDDGSTWVKGNVLDKNFPVSGFSEPAYTKDGTSYTTTIFGGKNADGKIINYLWKYNVKEGWAEEHVERMPARQGMTMLSYTHDPRLENTFWILIGGESVSDSGETEYSSDIYYSQNKGITWHKAETSFNFPEEFDARSFMSHYIDTTDANMIHLFGGANGTGFLNEIWRGRLNKLLFTPIE